MSEYSQYYADSCAGSFASLDADECGCHGHGYFLSEVDTWHRCPVHYVAGQGHPLDSEVEGWEAEAPALSVEVADDDNIPF